MRSFLNSGAAVLAAASFASVVSADNCAAGAEEIAGNWYCQAVNTIQYTGFGGSGTYNQITNMNSANGQCSSTPVSYSGSMAPLDEEVSIHFRGPIALKQFAVYTPATAASKAKRAAVPEAHAPVHEHGHAHFHKKREPQTWVTVTMDGQVVSWINDYNPGAASSTQAAAVQTTLATSVKAAATSVLATSIPATSVLAAATSVAAAAVNVVENIAVNVGSGGWEQVGYYNSEAGSSTGLTFMGNHGGAGSGVWDSTFGLSLAYLSSDASTGAASAQTLQDMTVPSGTEFSIFSSTPCTSGSGCGYYRPGSVANHGFAGSEKVFLFEVEMPLDSSATGFNADMPAIWMLNAQIPRCGQYVAETCSCWSSGCGEFDIFEVLTSGSTKAKSTMHGNDASGNAGDSDYFNRPTSGTIKLAAIMSNFTMTIKTLPNSYSFTSSLTESAISNLLSATTSGLNNGLGVSNLVLTDNS